MQFYETGEEAEPEEDSKMELDRALQRAVRKSDQLKKDHEPVA